MAETAITDSTLVRIKLLDEGDETHGWTSEIRLSEFEWFGELTSVEAFALRCALIASRCGRVGGNGSPLYSVEVI